MPKCYAIEKRFRWENDQDKLWVFSDEANRDRWVDFDLPFGVRRRFKIRANHPRVLWYCKLLKNNVPAWEYDDLVEDTTMTKTTPVIP